MYVISIRINLIKFIFLNFSNKIFNSYMYICMLVDEEIIKNNEYITNSH
jgi:hypothetical protein